MESTTSKPISLLAYAKRRGVSAEAVRKAIDAGRLERSVVVVRGKPKIADADLADREWAERTRPPGEQRPSALAVAAAAAFAGADEAGSGSGIPADAPDATIDFFEARRRREVELWRQARVKREADELALEKQKGQLVAVEEARAAVIDRFTVVKTKLLGLPARVKQRLPHVGADDVRVIDSLVREALEDLADDRDGD